MCGTASSGWLPKSRATWLGSDPARAPVVQGAIGDDKTWRLFVNVTPEKMHGSAGLGRRKATRRKLRMLTRPQVQRYSTESGLRDIMIAEKEVVLTFLL
jgi:hypothetical protein